MTRSDQTGRFGKNMTMAASNFETFRDDIVKMSSNIASRARKCSNEEQTKQSLIQPLILAWGYDIFDPDEVVLEFEADIPSVKKRSGKAESVDYAICRDGDVMFILEAKDVSEDLDRHSGQLSRYFQCCLSRIAVLGNGLEYRFYSDFDRDNIMDADPFRVIFMEKLTDDDIKFLYSMSKGDFDEEKLREQAERDRYLGKLEDLIASEFDEPSDEWIRMLLGRGVYDGVKKSSKIREFRPLVLEALDRVVASKYDITSSIARIAKNDGPVPPMDPVLDPDPVPVPDDGQIAVCMKSSKGDFDANGVYHRDGSVVVLSGSRIDETCAEYFPPSLKEFRQELYDSGTISNGVLNADIVFSTPSAAAAFVNGRNPNGWQRWKTLGGEALEDVVDEKLPPRRWPPYVIVDAPETCVTETGPGPDSPALDEGAVESPMPRERRAKPEKHDESGYDLPITVFMKRDTGLEASSYDAEGLYLGDGKLAVLKGSKASTEEKWVTSGASSKRSRLIDEDGTVMDDVEFDTPSGAGVFVRGASTNGWWHWKVEDGRSLGDFMGRPKS